MLLKPFLKRAPHLRCQQSIVNCQKTQMRTHMHIKMCDLLPLAGNMPHVRLPLLALRTHLSLACFFPPLLLVALLLLLLLLL